jgi:hypothetical protein
VEQTDELVMKRAVFKIFCGIVAFGLGLVIWLWAKSSAPDFSQKGAPLDAPEFRALVADSGRSTNLIAVGAWSEPVSDAAGYTLRGRLLLYDMPHYTTDYGANGPQEWWGNAPLYLELENLSARTDKSLAVYFAIGDGLECELMNADGRYVTNAPMRAYNGPGTPWTRQFWAMVPYDGSVRLRADPMLGGSSPKPSGLVICLAMSKRWLIPAGGSNVFYLAGNFSPPTNHPVPPGVHVWSGRLDLPPMKITAPRP